MNSAVLGNDDADDCVTTGSTHSTLASVGRHLKNRATANKGFASRHDRHVGWRNHQHSRGCMLFHWWADCDWKDIESLIAAGSPPHRRNRSQQSEKSLNQGRGRSGEPLLDGL